MINVTKTYMPDREKYITYVNKIFDRGWVTNHGELVQQLEKRLAAYLGVKDIVLVANGTIALEIAYRLLKLKGEVITTPFSFVATTSSLVSNGLEPVFADIDQQSFNLDPQNIEQQITDKTSAIVPVHIFGNACEVEKIEEIAAKHQLKVIYDAAHAFGVEYKGESLLRYGDVSTLSFHATKLFHTIEGGALIINDASLVQEARYLINFGIDGPDSVKALGTNAKMNEFEAAMGLCVLDEIEIIRAKRRRVYERYKKAFEGVVLTQKKSEDTTCNYAYFPLLFETQNQMLSVKKALEDTDIYTRRYFHPSLDTLNYIKSNQIMSVSRDISSRILALPMFPQLEDEDQMKIIEIVQKSLGV